MSERRLSYFSPLDSKCSDGQLPEPGLIATIYDLTEQTADSHVEVSESPALLLCHWSLRHRYFKKSKKFMWASLGVVERCRYDLIRFQCGLVPALGPLLYCLFVLPAARDHIRVVGLPMSRFVAHRFDAGYDIRRGWEMCFCVGGGGVLQAHNLIVLLH